MRSPKAAVVLLLDWTTLLALARGQVSSVWMSSWSVHVRQALRQPWLGPGLVLAVILAVWAMRSREPEPAGPTPRRRFRKPALDAFRGAPRHTHPDLEV